jgi:hypothetical protein
MKTKRIILPPSKIVSGGETVVVAAQKISKRLAKGEVITFGIGFLKDGRAVTTEYCDPPPRPICYMVGPWPNRTAANRVAAYWNKHWQAVRKDGEQR